jgi:hypothetical protein
MRCVTLALLMMTLAACAAPMPLPRAELAPPLMIEPVQISLERVRADRDQSAPIPSLGVASEDRVSQGVFRSPVTYRMVTETIEVPVRPEERYELQPSYSSYDAYLRERNQREDRRTTAFPVNTAVGAGIGAIIGNQSGNRDRGALIGSGVGLLFDLGRWLR